MSTQQLLEGRKSERESKEDSGETLVPLVLEGSQVPTAAWPEAGQLTGDGSGSIVSTSGGMSTSGWSHNTNV